MLIFYIVMWVLWKAQNDRIFNNEAVSAGEVVDKIKEMSWHWFLASLAKSSSLFFERTCVPAAMPYEIPMCALGEDLYVLIMSFVFFHYNRLCLSQFFIST